MAPLRLEWGGWMRASLTSGMICVHAPLRLSTGGAFLDTNERTNNDGNRGPDSTEWNTG